MAHEPLDLVGPASDPTASRTMRKFLSTQLAQSLEDAMYQRDELFGIDERTLYFKLRDNNQTPTQTDNCLRTKFWLEYERISAAGRGGIISTSAICAGVCNVDYFYHKYMKSPTKVAWLFCPPLNYIVKMEETLNYATERMRDVLDLPILERGKVNTKIIELQFKIWSFLEMRKNGAFIQKNLNVNVNQDADAKTIRNSLENATMEELEIKLKDLRKKDLAAQNVPTIEGQLVEPGIPDKEA